MAQTNVDTAVTLGGFFVASDAVFMPNSRGENHQLQTALLWPEEHASDMVHAIPEAAARVPGL